MKTDLFRNLAVVALTLVTSATFVLGAVAPAEAGAVRTVAQRVA